MQYDPRKHHRRSIRLETYDYATAAPYFVTIVCQNRMNLFGEITNGEMEPNAAGRMIDSWWQKIPEKFPSVSLDEFVVMPNHFHGIVLLNGDFEIDTPQTAAPTLPAVVAWFKSMTTNAYIRGVKQGLWTAFQERLWQRNYYEHVVRTDEVLNLIRDYIAGNPQAWDSDRENTARIQTPKTKSPWQV